MSGLTSLQHYRLVSSIKQLSFGRTLDEVIQVVRLAARDVTGADGVTFVLREGENVYYAEENAIAPLWKGKRFPATECISGWVMLNRNPAIVEDIYLDPRIPVAAYKPTFVKSLAMMPVRAEDPIAAIGAYWASQHRATDDEVDALQALADATSLALRNVELYSDLKAALDREHQARMEAEAACLAKDEWLSVISHELRTPLTPIRGWVRLLLTHTTTPATTEQALRVIDRNLLDHIKTVGDLVDVSKMVSGRFVLDPSEVNMRDCADEAAATLRLAAENKRIVLVITSEEQCRVRGDRARLCQMLFNVLQNAIKFTPAGGRVEMNIRAVDGLAEITVRDNGPGIPKEVMPRLFTRFQQGDSSQTRAVGGFGLGLWIVRQLAELHGGTVDADSVRGKGATLTVRLPLLQ